MSGAYISDVLRCFRFGCRYSKQGSFENQDDGIMVLDRGVQLPMVQMSSTYGNAFSYCLPPIDTGKRFFQFCVCRAV